MDNRKDKEVEMLRKKLGRPKAKPEPVKAKVAPKVQEKPVPMPPPKKKEIVCACTARKPGQEKPNLCNKHKGMKLVNGRSIR